MVWFLPLCPWCWVCLPGRLTHHRVPSIDANLKWWHVLWLNESYFDKYTSKLFNINTFGDLFSLQLILLVFFSGYAWKLLSVVLHIQCYMLIEQLHDTKNTLKKNKPLNSGQTKTALTARWERKCRHFCFRRFFTFWSQIAFPRHFLSLQEVPSNHLVHWKSCSHKHCLVYLSFFIKLSPLMQRSSSSQG